MLMLHANMNQIQVILLIQLGPQLIYFLRKHIQCFRLMYLESSDHVYECYLNLLTIIDVYFMKFVTK